MAVSVIAANQPQNGAGHCNMKQKKYFRVMLTMQ